MIASFLILAWTFYELSGGTDFEPRGMRPPKPEPQIAEAKTPLASRAPAAVIALRTPRATDPAVITDESRIARLKAQQAERAARLAQLRSGLGQPLVFYSGQPGNGSAAGQAGTGPDHTGLGGAGGIALTSLEQGAAGLRAAEPEPAAAPAPRAEPEPDLREVTGARVNMREGPGTIYPVVARLVLGHEVEVLSASGTGWLRLRTLPEQQVGWVASSLIGKDRR
ncbi:SH3 domain-containing protein [Antarcticimicrobium luteum]|uniref:SH3 domain-containing protein n=1 Tax=Antarcticimicrobium luteum TaxID=2547397 RepID=UPI00140735D8|nr:SH3 domain-containing protein [Antarcticimicrobium luteum]